MQRASRDLYPRSAMCYFERTAAILAAPVPAGSRRHASNEDTALCSGSFPEADRKSRGPTRQVRATFVDRVAARVARRVFVLVRFSLKGREKLRTYTAGSHYVARWGRRERAFFSGFHSPPLTSHCGRGDVLPWALGLRANRSPYRSGTTGCGWAWFFCRPTRARAFFRGASPHRVLPRGLLPRGS